MRDEKGRFIKGNISCNKDGNGIRKGMPPWNKGMKLPQNCGENNPHWRGGRTKTEGYVWVYCPGHPRAHNKYVPEHRLVIEKYLGIYLSSKETVHHLGKRDDNRLHMLMCFSSHSAHRRFHGNPNNVKLSEIIFDGKLLTLNL